MEGDTSSQDYGSFCDTSTCLAHPFFWGFVQSVRLRYVIWLQRSGQHSVWHLQFGSNESGKWEILKEVRVPTESIPRGAP